MEIKIRLATVQDREFITGLAPRFAECELPPWRSRETIVQGTAPHVCAAVERGNDDRSVVLVAELHGERVGFAWALIIEDFYTRKPVGKVSEIATARDGTGAGKALMEACEEWARSIGAELMVLNVLEGNTQARAFYRRLGYAPEYTMFAKALSTRPV